MTDDNPELTPEQLSELQKLVEPRMGGTERRPRRRLTESAEDLTSDEEGA